MAIVAPYMKPLTQLVVEYVESEGINVADWHALEIPDNLAVGARDPMALVEIYKKVSLKNVDALVLSACVQMPSLAAIPVVEAECGIPVVSAAVCTAYDMLKRLGLPAKVPNAGRLLCGDYGYHFLKEPL